MTEAHKIFQRATQYHQQHRYQEAANHYKAVLQLNPQHADAWHLLGLVQSEQGSAQEGLESISKALQYQPRNPAFLVNRGIIKQRIGGLFESMQDFHAALQIDPTFIPACIQLGDAYLAVNQPKSALPLYQYILEKDKKNDRVWHNLGNVYMALENYEQAREVFDTALQYQPQQVETLSNQGVVFFSLHQFDKAVDYYQRALKLNPAYAHAWNNLGITYTRLGEFVDAEEAFEKAIKYQPNYAEAYNHLGTCYKDQGKVEQAKKSFLKALQLKSNYPEAIFNLAITELVQGNFQEGWKHYEVRHQLKEHVKNSYHLPQPFWQGESLENKTLFILVEQGLGDTIQFIRFLPQLQKQAHPENIIVECQTPLIPLLQPNFPDIQFVPRGQIPPNFDIQIHLMSLPHFLHITLENISDAAGYLTLPIGKINTNLPQSLLNNTNQHNIGLVWAGNPQHPNDHNRSIALTYFKSLMDIPRTQWFSLQWGESQQDILEHSENKLENLAPYIQDFTDTALILQHLDLVITVDTAIAHLAGSLGKKAWVLLPFAPDFRWLLDRQDSPWYDSLTLYRQPKPGDWESVLNKIKEELMKI